jgi:DNA-binding MarR family transcriptional regulator
VAELPELDPVVHAPVRLAILSILAGAEEAEFTYLRDKIGASDGNLSVHLSKLEAAGYIAIQKSYAGKKPLTRCRATEEGRAALAEYVKSLKRLLGKELTKKRY